MDSLKYVANFLISLSIVLSPNLSFAMYEEESSSDEEEVSSYHGQRRINPYPLADEHASRYREKSQTNPHSSISQVADTFDGSIPHLYPLFTIRHWGNDLLEVCREEQFITNCGRYDGECKTEKGLCGEHLSTSFFYSETNWNILEGHYNGNKGFDGFYKVNSPHIKFVVVEDKAGEAAKLDKKTGQMSLAWQADRAQKLYDYGKIDASTLSEFRDALARGQVVSLFTRTLYRDNGTQTQEKEYQTYSESLFSTEGSPPSYSTPSYSYDTSTSDSYTWTSAKEFYTFQKVPYSFSTEVSLLGSPEWESKFTTRYIYNYQTGIHQSIFGSVLKSRNCSIPGGSHCLSQNEVEDKNFNILSRYAPDQISFGL